MRTDTKRRAGDKIARLAGGGLDLVSFWRASTEVLAGAVPHAVLVHAGSGLAAGHQPL
jgi:hypothetical protein